MEMLQVRCSSSTTIRFSPGKWNSSREVAAHITTSTASSPHCPSPPPMAALWDQTLPVKRFTLPPTSMTGWAEHLIASNHSETLKDPPPPTCRQPEEETPSATTNVQLNSTGKQLHWVMLSWLHLWLHHRVILRDSTSYLVNHLEYIHVLSSSNTSSPTFINKVNYNLWFIFVLWQIREEKMSLFISIWSDLWMCFLNNVFNLVFL